MLVARYSTNSEHYFKFSNPKINTNLDSYLFIVFNENELQDSLLNSNEQKKKKNLEANGLNKYLISLCSRIK